MCKLLRCVVCQVHGILKKCVINCPISLWRHGLFISINNCPFFSISCLLTGSSYIKAIVYVYDNMWVQSRTVHGVVEDIPARARRIAQSPVETPFLSPWLPIAMVTAAGLPLAFMISSIHSASWVWVINYKNERTNEWMNKQTNKRTNERTNERTKKRTNQQTNAQTNEQTD